MCWVLPAAAQRGQARPLCRLTAQHSLRERRLPPGAARPPTALLLVAARVLQQLVAAVVLALEQPVALARVLEQLVAAVLVFGQWVELELPRALGWLEAWAPELMGPARWAALAQQADARRELVVEQALELVRARL